MTNRKELVTKLAVAVGLLGGLSLSATTPSAGAGCLGSDRTPSASRGQVSREQPTRLFHRFRGLGCQ